MTSWLQRLGKCGSIAGEQLRQVGEVIVPMTNSRFFLWGRDEGGQPVHMDGAVQRAMITSGYCEHMPPLGALHWAGGGLPRALTFTLGGDEFPFRIFGWAEHRPNREIEEHLLEPFYKESGWRVEWGPEFMSEKDGYVRTFRLTNAPAETLGPEVGTYFALVRSELEGELKGLSVRLVEAGSEEEARAAAVADVIREDDSGCADVWEHSVSRLVRVDPEDAETLRKYLSGK